MFHRLLLPILAVAVAGCSSEPKTAVASNEPGLLGRVWETTGKLNPLKPKLKAREMKSVPAPDLKALAPTLTVDPVAPKLSEVRQMNVTLKLANKGKRVLHLDFPTTQRIDVVVKNKVGKVVERWSEDHRFENQAVSVTLNPGERLEYTASVATREMTAGETFTVEAWMPAYDAIRATSAVTPVK